MTQDVTIMNKVNNRELLKKMMKHKFPEFRIYDGRRYFAIYEEGYNKENFHIENRLYHIENL